MSKEQPEEVTQLTQRTLKYLQENQPEGASLPSWTVVDTRRRKDHLDETCNDWVLEAAALAKSGADL